MGQGFLFDTDDTGRGAYQRPREPVSSVSPGAVVVGDYLRSCGADGATQDEAIVTLRINPKMLRVLWCELERAGWIVNTGRTRLNLGGHKTEVYIAAEFIDGGS
jgi:hypothetical protein